jgi:hypothetical protein
LSPSADPRSFGRRPAFVRAWIGDAAALRMTFRGREAQARLEVSDTTGANRLHSTKIQKY